MIGISLEQLKDIAPPEIIEAIDYEIIRLRMRDKAVALSPELARQGICEWIRVVKSIPNAAVAPVAPWQGGKRLLAKTVYPLVEAIPHRCYAEPFTGMGGVFFRRQTRSQSEVINDISVDVVDLFRILQRHFPEFTNMIRWRLSSRAEFERLAELDPDTLTDLERAARFLYLQRLAFGGKIKGQTFGVDPARPSKFNTTRLLPQLEEVHDRLANVTIEQLD